MWRNVTDFPYGTTSLNLEWLRATGSQTGRAEIPNAAEENCRPQTEQLA